MQVLSLPIPIPCSGVSDLGTPFAWDTCSTDDAFGWAEAADSYAINVLGLDMSAFVHVVYIVPPGNPCSWAGLGYLGCDPAVGNCRTWVQGSLW